MINHFPRLIQTANRNPTLVKLLDSLQNKMQLYYPLEIANTEYGQQVFTKQKINKNTPICLIPTTQCFTGLELLNCDRNKTFQINESALNIAKENAEINTSQYYYINNMIKVLIQIFVQSRDEQLDLNLYAQYIREQQVSNPFFWDQQIIQQIYSLNLQSQILGNQLKLQQVYESLRKTKIFGLQFGEFLHIVSLIRKKNLTFIPTKPKQYDKDYILMMSPFIDLIQHQFNPNCYIDGIYNAQQAQSFVVLRSKETIEQGQFININYGNYGNHEFLMRFGYPIQNNPYNELTVELDFDDYTQYSSQMFGLKQKIFRTNLSGDVTLGQIKLYQLKINEDILTLLRVYFLQDSDIKKNTKIHQYLWKDFKKQISSENEKIVCEFMVQKLEALKIEQIQRKKDKLLYQYLLKNQSDIINTDNMDELHLLKDRNFRNLLQVCMEEELILQKNIDFFKKKLQTLI